MGQRECGRCEGTGVYQAECASCDGTGKEYGLDARGTCTMCGGSGREPVVCWSCDGTGQLAALSVVGSDGGESGYDPVSPLDRGAFEDAFGSGEGDFDDSYSTIGGFDFGDEDRW